MREHSKSGKSQAARRSYAAKYGMTRLVAALAHVAPGMTANLMTLLRPCGHGFELPQRHHIFPLGAGAAS